MTSPDLAAAVERLESALRTDAAARFVDASVDPKDLRLLIADWRARGVLITAADKLNHHNVEVAQAAAGRGGPVYRSYMAAVDRKLDEAFQVYFKATT